MRLSKKTRRVRTGLMIALAMAPVYGCSSSGNAPATTAPASAADQQAAADAKAKTEAAISSASDALHAKLLLAYGGELPSADVQRYVQKFGAALLIKADKGDVSLFAVDSTDVDHFSIPGRIYLTRGLLAALDNDAQLAAVIESEISQIKLGHLRTKIDAAHDQASGGLGGLFGGGGNYTAILNTALGIDKDTNHYNGTFAETDEFDDAKDALPRMAAAGYDPNQYHVYMEKMLAVHAKAVATHAITYQEAAKVEALTSDTIHTTPDAGWKVGDDTYKANVVDKIKELPLPASQPAN